MCFGLFVFWWMLVFAADARGTLLAAVISSGIVIYLFRKKIKQWIFYYFGGMGLGLLSYLILFKLITTEGRSVLSRYGDSGRFEMWENALNLIVVNPFLGVGPMHYADITNGFKFAAPHNIYLQIISEWGIPVVLILTLLIGYGIFKWLDFCGKERDNKQENSLSLITLAALTGSILAGGIHGFFSGIINTPLSQLIMIIVIAWIIGLYRKRNEKNGLPVAEPVRIRTYLLRLACVIILIFTFITVKKQISTLNESRQFYLEQSESRILYPRFWDQGLIYEE